MKSKKIDKLVEHQNPSEERYSRAPYNFVPLPDLLMMVADGRELEASGNKDRFLDERLPDHDIYYDASERHTGYFDVTLRTLSPLYVRCGLSAKKPGPDELSEFEAAEEEKFGKKPPSYAGAMKNKPEFFYTTDKNRPVIPGSSLRGMLRNLMEIVSFGKVEMVTDKNLFFRTVDDSAIGTHYRNRMVGNQRGSNKVRAGFLQRKGDEFAIKVCDVVRVYRKDLSSNFMSVYKGKSANMFPRWEGEPHQHQPVWIARDQNRPDLVDVISYVSKAGYQEGRLVITGNMNNKKKEFVFLLPEAGSQEIEVPEEMIERFHDDDQITQWQRDAFPKSEPRKDCRERDGMLRANPKGWEEPVFFLCENDKLTFLGRAQMFRLPYINTPRDLVPKDLRLAADIDFAEALFGYTKRKKKNEGDTDGVTAEQGSKQRAYASRVFVTDAHLEDPSAEWKMPGNPITPRILATPKPTAFQNYLSQPSRELRSDLYKKSLSHYDSPTPPRRGISSERSVIRGHKLYWHKAWKEGLSLAQIREMIEEEKSELGKIVENEERGKPETQHTRFTPARPDVNFKFRVYFENLSDEELGALCWTLQPLGEPGASYSHKLGMGKPLGLGSIGLKAVLQLGDRADRYSKLFSGDGWHTGYTSSGEDLSERSLLESRVKPFESLLLGALNMVGGRNYESLSEVDRISKLLAMMQWPGIEPDKARYETLEEFKKRRALPDPLAVRKSLSPASPEKADVGRPGESSLQETAKRTTLKSETASEMRPQDSATSKTSKPVIRKLVKKPVA